MKFITQVSNKNQLISVESVSEFYRAAYSSSDKLTKLQLKAWMYYSQCHATGGKDCLTFSDFVESATATDYLTLIKGYCIDPTDICTKAEAIHLILDYYRRKQG